MHYHFSNLDIISELRQSHSESHCLYYKHKVFSLMFFSSSLSSRFCMKVFDLYWNYFLWGTRQGWSFIFLILTTSFPSNITICWKDYIFSAHVFDAPLWINGWLAVVTQVYFWVLYSVPLFCMFIFMLVSCCFCYYGSPWLHSIFWSQILWYQQHC
jgi:hypothetical protein